MDVEALVKDAIERDTIRKAQTSFARMKELLAGPKTLILFNPKMPLVV
jgi:hypothetical protein